MHTEGGFLHARKTFFPSKVSLITFEMINGFKAVFYEVGFATVPEPSTALGALMLVMPPASALCPDAEVNYARDRHQSDV